MIRFGKISEVNASAQLARVNLPDDGIVTDWLPYLVAGSKDDKYNKTIAVNELVALYLDENGEDGVIFGSIYDETNTAPSDGRAGVTFEDGGKIFWNTGKLTVQKGLTTFEVGESGVKIERAGDSLKTALTDLATQIQATVLSWVKMYVAALIAGTKLTRMLAANCPLVLVLMI